MSIDVTGIWSGKDFDDSSNFVLQYQLSSLEHITGISYNVNLTANDPSYLSEISTFISDSSGINGVPLNPASGDDYSGTETFGQTLNLASRNQDFFLGVDGLLKLQFFEAYYDGNQPDGLWNSGSLLLSYGLQPTAVSEPSTWALAVLGMAAIRLGQRRRGKRADLIPVYLD